MSVSKRLCLEVYCERCGLVVGHEPYKVRVPEPQAICCAHEHLISAVCPGCHHVWGVKPQQSITCSLCGFQFYTTKRAVPEQVKDRVKTGYIWDVRPEPGWVP